MADLIERLAPCPFCGGEASQPIHDDEFDTYFIKCGTCEARIPNDDRDELLADWNSREGGLVADLLAENERLREALRPFSDCCDQIGDDESDAEWAKFRLLISDFRRARQALEQKP